MYESISKNNELENEMTLDMSYFWYSDASGSGLVKNDVNIIVNGVDNLDFEFAHDHDVIQAQECAQILTNSVLKKKCKNG